MSVPSRDRSRPSNQFAVALIQDSANSHLQRSYRMQVPLQINFQKMDPQRPWRRVYKTGPAGLRSWSLASSHVV